MVAMLGVTLVTKAQVLVSGKFVDDKAVCQIYEMQSDSSYCLLEATTKVKHKYLLKFEVNKIYLVKFTNKDNKSKTMRFISYQSGNIDLDVDFKTSKNAYVTIKNNKTYLKRTNEPLLVIN